MKRMVALSFCLLLTSASAGVAKTPSTRVPVLRPMTEGSGQRPQTGVQTVRPVSSAIQHPATQVEVVRPQTRVTVTHPQTTVAVTHPTTTVEVIHPATQVEVVRPQTSVEVIHPQTFDVAETGENVAGKPVQKKGGKTTMSAQAITSMSDYKPKPAKDLTAAQKAAPLGGGDLTLGNSTDQSAKDAAAKASLLGSQNNQNMNLDPKQNKVNGLDKIVTDRAKQRGKRK